MLLNRSSNECYHFDDKMLGFILLMVKTDIILIKRVVSYGVQDNVICSNNKINEDSIEKFY
ncbi:hypothetical protein BANRA_02745 [Escherichia coli]|nr:hypothetical protein BANRA_02745 [Escherichia coli]